MVRLPMGVTIELVNKDGGTLQENEAPYHYQGMTWEQVVEEKRRLVEARQSMGCVSGSL